MARCESLSDQVTTLPAAGSEQQMKQTVPHHFPPHLHGVK